MGLGLLGTGRWGSSAESFQGTECVQPIPVSKVAVEVT